MILTQVLTYKFLFCFVLFLIKNVLTLSLQKQRSAVQTHGVNFVTPKMAYVHCLLLVRMAEE